MKIALIRFKQREGANSSIPWHFSFYKDILEPLGHRVDIIDDQVESLGIDKLVEICISRGYQLIGTGGIGTVYKQLKDFSEKIKIKNNKVVVVVGGQIVADHAFIMDSCMIDIIVCGEGEVTLKNIINAIEKGFEWQTINGIIFRKDGNLIITEPEKLIKLDDLPDFNFKNINIDKYDTNVSNIYLINDNAHKLKEKGHRYISIFLARGCPYNCFFCYRHLKGYRTYSRERLEKILSGLKEKGFSFISYGDECITANKNNLKNICELSKKYDIYWITSGRADHLNDEVISMLKNHNCAGLQIGVESFDASMLEIMNKRISPQQNIDAMNIIYKYGLHTTLQLVSGSPGENRKTILNTRKGMWSCFFKDDKIASAILNPYPGSPAYYYGIEKGLIKDKEWVHKNFSNKGEIIVNLSDLSICELRAWQVWLFFEASLSYRVKNRRLIINKSFIIRLRNFLLSYVRLMLEPQNFLYFTLYLLIGFKYWLRPLSAPRYIT